MNERDNTLDHSSQLPTDCQQVELAIVFFDLSRMAVWSSGESDRTVATFFQSFYELAAEKLEPPGRIVKYIGDAGLVVCQREAIESLVFQLAEFADETRALAAKVGFDTHLNTNVHFGPVIAGDYGPPGLRRYDVIGKAVNVAARLGRKGLVLSPQAFRCLSPEGRQRFDKLTLPVTYALR